MFKKFLIAVFCTFMLLCTAVSAADIKSGDTAYVVYGGTVGVSKYPSLGSNLAVITKGAKVTVLEAYVTGDDNCVFHKIQLQDGKIGYIPTNEYIGITILEPAETAEKELNKQWESSDTNKYQHAINMTFLSDYIYGGSKTTEGTERNYYAKVPTEWVRHDRPASLPLVGKAIVHIGDNGKIGSVKASFYPGNPPINYHALRIDELTQIGYAPVSGAEASKTAANANTAFYATVTSEFDVVAYNDEWVAVWSEGGVDESCGAIVQCGESNGTAFQSWKPAVYFLPRKNCYILDINNQVSTAPKIEAVGKSTGLLMVKTTPDETDYVKSGIYKINQSIQIVDATPQNGHYKIYYQKGLYYVDAKYVNVQLANSQKPTIQYKTTAAADFDISDGTSVIGAVKKGAAIDVIEKDYDGTNSKIWFNSKECTVPTSQLGEFTKVMSAADTAKLGSPIGVLAMDAAWSERGAKTYSAEGLAKLKSYLFGYIYDSDKHLEYSMWTLNPGNDINEIQDKEWVNVYGIEEFSFDSSEEARNALGLDTTILPPDPVSGKIYTIYYNGEIRYLVQQGESITFNYYPGNGYSKNSVAKTQTLCLDGRKINTAAYNIDGNNYFKIRDIAEILDGTIKSFDITYDSATNSIDMLSFYDYTPVGGELTQGDGVERTAYSSSALVSLDGVPIKATCYNIDGNNYFKLRDITDALDCRVVWDNENQMIWVIPSRTAYDDPSEAVG